MYVRRREENTRAYLDFYYREPMVAFNRYIRGKPQEDHDSGGGEVIEPFTGPIPTFAESKARLPSPFWAGHQEAIDCYWSTWEIVRT
jgi:hypothetical protein